MLKLVWALMLGGASSACALAAVGLALYAPGPSAVAAAQWFAAIGFVVGGLCGGLHRLLRGPAPASPTPLAPDALASLVRSALATAAAERQARPGSAADRRPGAPAPASDAKPALAATPAVPAAPLAVVPRQRAEATAEA